ncbi:MAG: YbhB/YbcL family Raf kinase inhibitor-like protein [Acidobacteria bacterium]|nr:YbhB/YbcL family Raf kinase inhibitor-like protein [Acidobacteriota bacterium]
MELSSPAFADHGLLPAAFTGDGADRSPPLCWRDVPPGTQAFALVVEDPDAPAGLWVHWVLYDLPGALRELPEAQPPQGTLASGARQGRNSLGRLGYNGPSPPPGKAHRYFFRLIALGAPTGLPAGATRAELVRALENRILGEAQWVGTYRR